MTDEAVLGLDIGTTSVKAVLFQRDGTVVCEHEVACPMKHPQPDRAEHDPVAVERSARDAVRWIAKNSDIPPERWIGCGLSCAMHSLICLDEQKKPLSPSLSWADRRSIAQAEQLQKERPEIHERTGTPLHPMSPLVKLIWMREHHYPPYEQAAYVVSVKEYILNKWFGTTVVDYATASASGLFHHRRLDWDEDVLTLAGIERRQLFDPVPPTTVLRTWRKDIAVELGIPPHLPVAVGASDGPLANLGIGAVDESDWAVTIGTSGAIRRFSATGMPDTEHHTFCYAVADDLWITGGPTNNGGNVLHWLTRLFDGVDDPSLYETYIAEAESVPPGADGLLCLPYFHGERAPYWQAHAKGSFHGVTAAHRKAHFVRAALEGVIFHLYHIAQHLGASNGRLYASGGFLRSHLWPQILADVFGQEVVVPRSHQSSAWGAAWMALFGLGEVSSLKTITSCIPVDGTLHPDPERHPIYQEQYEVFRRYASLEFER